jgi:iron complex transport system substrate-binding protein
MLNQGTPPTDKRPGFFILSKMKRRLLMSACMLMGLCFGSVSAGSCASQNLRVVSLAPSTTEILFALGLDREIVGVTLFCDYPSGAKTKESVGTFSQPNVEKILSLKPDIIFCTGLEQAPVIEKLKKLNLKVYVSDPATLQDLFSSISEIGSLCRKEAQAKDLIKTMKTALDEIKTKLETTTESTRPKVLVEIWHDPLIAAGRGSLIDEILITAGAVNIAQDTPRPFCFFSPEQVIQRDPDYIILAYMDEDGMKERIKNRLGWGQITAVKKNQILNDISPDILLRPGPRVVEAIEKIHKKIYPS